MKRRRRWHLSAVVLLLSSTGPLLSSAHAATAAPPAVINLQTGYWATSFPALVTTPPRGLRVASNVAGAQAVSAIRFDVSPGSAAAALTLTIAQAQPSSGQVALSACPPTSTTANWDPTEGAGAFADRPTADCAAAEAAGELSADGKSITVDLTQLGVTDGSVNVVLVPTGSPTFDVSFEQARPEAVTTTVASGGSAAGPEEATAPPGSSGDGGAGGASDSNASTQPPPADDFFLPIAEAEAPTFTGSLPQPLAVAAPPPVLSASPSPVAGGDIAQLPFGSPPGQPTALGVPGSNTVAERAVLFAALAVVNAAVLNWHLAPRRLRNLPLLRRAAAD